MVLLNVNSTSQNIGEIDQQLRDSPKHLPFEIESDEPELESDLHREQINLLIRLLKYYWRDRQDIYVTGNLTVYYNPNKIKNRDFRGPDVFVVLDAEKRDRKSWVLWHEGNQYPNLVIELLSDSTAKVDRSTKKQLYQDVWRLPNYFWFDPHTLEFAGFKLVDGKYQAITPNSDGYLWCDQINLYLGIEKNQLRWFTVNGELIPLPEEQERLAKEQEHFAKEQERFAKEQERFAKEQFQQRVTYLEELLRSQGIDPDQLAN
jgi:Uma2 family endonuclease